MGMKIQLFVKPKTDESKRLQPKLVEIKPFAYSSSSKYFPNIVLLKS